MNTVIRNICRFLALALVFSPLSTAYAGMLSTAQIATVHQGVAQRATLLAALDRTEVASQLSALGVDPAAARERVAAMSDEEVRTLNGQIQSLPAGGMADGWWWAIGVIVIAAIVWYAYGYQNQNR